MIFRCDECAVCTQDCLHVDNNEVNSESVAKVAAALREMLNIKPGTIRKKQIPYPDRFAKRGLKNLVASLFEEIKATRDAGHGFYSIARVISESGPHIDQNTLRLYFRTMEANHEQT